MVKSTKQPKNIVDQKKILTLGKKSRNKQRRNNVKSVEAAFSVSPSKKPSNAQHENNEKMRGGITGKGFVPGICPNPSGRPKGRCLTTILEDILERKVLLKDPFTKQPTLRPIEDQLMFNLIAKALSKGPNSLSAIKEILDRIEGKSLQRLEHSGPDGDDIPHEIKVSFVDKTEIKKKVPTKKKKRGS